MLRSTLKLKSSLTIWFTGSSAWEYPFQTPTKFIPNPDLKRVHVTCKAHTSWHWVRFADQHALAWGPDPRNQEQFVRIYNKPSKLSWAHVSQLHFRKDLLSEIYKLSNTFLLQVSPHPKGCSIRNCPWTWWNDRANLGQQKALKNFLTKRIWWTEPCVQDREDSSLRLMKIQSWRKTETCIIMVRIAQQQIQRAVFNVKVYM